MAEPPANVVAEFERQLDADAKGLLDDYLAAWDEGEPDGEAAAPTEELTPEQVADLGRQFIAALADVTADDAPPATEPTQLAAAPPEPPAPRKIVKQVERDADGFITRITETQE